MNLNFFRLFPSRRCITAIWMTLSQCLATKMSAMFFLHSFNLLHPFSPFSFEKRFKLAFFSVGFFEKSLSKFITSIYRKSTFIGQYLRWNFFSLQKRKTSLILTLTHQVLAICFTERLPSELDKIKFVLQTNGYPEHVINLFMAKKMKKFYALPKFGPESCTFYVRLLRSGFVSVIPVYRFTSKMWVKRGFPLWNNAFFTLYTNELFSATNKDVLPDLQRSNVIYQFSCHYDSRYLTKAAEQI